MIPEPHKRRAASEDQRRFPPANAPDPNEVLKPLLRRSIKPKTGEKTAPKVKKTTSKDPSSAPKKEEPLVKDIISAAIRAQRLNDMVSSLPSGAIDRKTLVTRPSSPPASPPRSRSVTVLADRTCSPTQLDNEQIIKQRQASDTTIQGDLAESCYPECVPSTPDFSDRIQDHRCKRNRAASPGVATWGH